MQNESLVLGSAFSDWSQLTEQYVHEMEALRRKEPGSSARMMEIARRMTQYQQLVVRDEVQPVTPAPQRRSTLPRSSAPRSGHWLSAAAEMLFGSRANDGNPLLH